MMRTNAAATGARLLAGLLSEHQQSPPSALQTFVLASTSCRWMSPSSTAIAGRNAGSQSHAACVDRRGLE